MSAIPIDKQISCVEREIKLRKNVYKKRIDEGKMSREEANYEYRAMQAVLQTLNDCKDSTLSDKNTANLLAEIALLRADVAAFRDLADRLTMEINQNEGGRYVFAH